MLSLILICIRALFFAMLMSVLLPTAEGVTQDKFVLTPTTPGETDTTWLDVFSTSIKTHIDLPEGLSVPGLRPDSSKTSVFVLARKLKVLTKDGNDVVTLRVS